MNFPRLLGSTSATNPNAHACSRYHKLSRQFPTEKPCVEQLPPQGLGDVVGKVRAAEARIRSILFATFPEVKIQLRRIESSSASSLAHQRTGCGAVFVPTTPDVEAGSSSEELLLLTNEEHKAAKPIAEGSQPCLHTDGQTRCVFVAVLAAGVAALTSLACVAFAVQFRVDPWLIAPVVAIVSASGPMYVWYARVTSVQAALIESLEELVPATQDAFQRADDWVAGLSQRVIDAVDDMVVELQSVLESSQKTDNASGDDMPDPSLLKQPLEDLKWCRYKTPALLGEVDESLPRFLFAVGLIGWPFLLLFLSSAMLGWIQLGLNSAILSRQELDWMGYVRQWMFQMILMVAQIVAASSGSRLNDMIANLEQRANVRLNKHIAVVINKVCGRTVERVLLRCDVFFPKLRRSLDKLDLHMGTVQVESGNRKE